MKRSSIYLYIMLLLVVSVSCSEDLLVEDPPHILGADNLFTDLQGFETGINGLYSLWRRERSGSNFDGGANEILNIPMMAGTDNIYGNHRDATDLIFNQFGPRNHSEVNFYNVLWTWLYEMINGTNTIITRAENPSVDWNEADKNRIIAEAKIFRAWAYRHLTYLWGDVPMTLNESGSVIRTDWRRTPVSEILTQMEEDLLFAEAHLPGSMTQPGRLVKQVAQHYLSELYLRQGNYDRAEVMAKRAIEEGPFSLVTARYGVRSSLPGTPFSDIFLDGNSNFHEGNTEALWTMQNEFQTVGGNGHNIMRRQYLNNYFDLRVDGVQLVLISVENGGRPQGRSAPTKYGWYDIYEEQDDRGSGFIWSKYYIINNPGTLPAGYSMGDTLWVTQGEPEIEREYNPWWPTTKKWNSATQENVNDSRQYNDQVYIRLAETYLLLAEAQFYKGDLGAAAQTLNVVRRRSNASEITASEVTLDFILDERARELHTEEHRRYTLLRTGTWLDRTRRYNALAGPNVTERDRLLPIPQIVLDANLDYEMEQNPGY